MSTVTLPVLSEIRSLNEEVEKVKNAKRLCKVATRKSLADLYKLVQAEITEYESYAEQAAEEPVLGS